MCLNVSNTATKYCTAFQLIYMFAKDNTLAYSAYCVVLLSTSIYLRASSSLTNVYDINYNTVNSSINDFEFDYF